MCPAVDIHTAIVQKYPSMGFPSHTATILRYWARQRHGERMVKLFKNKLSWIQSCDAHSGRWLNGVLSKQRIEATRKGTVQIEMIIIGWRLFWGGWKYLCTHLVWLSMVEVVGTRPGYTMLTTRIDVKGLPVSECDKSVLSMHIYLEIMWRFWLFARNESICG